MRRPSRHAPAAVDLSTTVGGVRFPNPVMTASGTAGHGAELRHFFDLSALGGVVVKSLAAFPWEGNAAPRVHETPGGMLNSVGLQGPGVESWLAHELPDLLAAGCTRIVASIWGRSVEEYEAAARLLSSAPGEVVAVEVNLSCPNTEAGRHLFAHDPAAAAEVVAASAAHGRPTWAKLSPNTDRLVDVAGAVAGAGAAAVTLVNTLLGLSIDPHTRTARLGNGGGGLSGPAIHPVAVRAVHDVHAALGDLPIVGVGGIATADDAVELLLAGASAVQVGTATFARPTAPHDVLTSLERWCRRDGVSSITELIGAAHV
ncbi:MAG TPA: dihydroorotate dehydrogenase [Acidimicrobiales bacterium]|nr:dihydroorotate dehydrogenase [Acidimicrobiales bacterium]